MPDDELSMAGKVELSVVEVLSLTKGIGTLAQMQMDALRFVINLISNRPDDADKALGSALANFTLARSSNEQLVARLARQVAALRSAASPDQDERVEESNLRKWMNQLEGADMRQAYDVPSPPTARPDPSGEVDALRQSLENRLAQLHGDVDMLSRKLESDFRWLIGVQAAGVVIMIGVVVAGILYLANQLAG